MKEFTGSSWRINTANQVEEDFERINASKNYIFVINLRQ